MGVTVGRGVRGVDARLISRLTRRDVTLPLGVPYRSRSMRSPVDALAY